ADQGEEEQCVGVGSETRQATQCQRRTGHYVQEKNCDLKHRIPTGRRLIFVSGESSHKVLIFRTLPRSAARMRSRRLAAERFGVRGLRTRSRGEGSMLDGV